MKFIFITGGVTSSLGKGIVSASLGALLKARGYKVRNKKMDPYLNVDPGTMNPIQHGEVFVLDDGAETDLDLGHYERFTGNTANKNDSISAGKIYFNVLEKERRGDYLGETIQVIPHVTNEIKAFIERDLHDEDFVICEIGGTVGDIEATPFLEAVRQFANDKGHENVLFLHLTLVPYLETSDEIKTKPTQHSVRELQSLGIKPDILLCRSSHTISEAEKRKIALFCNVDIKDVIEGRDLSSIYKVPLSYHRQGIDERVLYHFGIENSKIDVSQWQDIEHKIDSYTHEITVALVGKYVSLKDSYKSISEALVHAGLYTGTKVNIRWINSEIFESENVNYKEIFQDINGIIVAPGFGGRGVEGKIKAVHYARVNRIPFLGICFGMQMAIIEASRNLLNIADATSSEFSQSGTSVVGLIEEWLQDGELQKRNINSQMGGTLRLGSYDCVLQEGSKIAEIYDSHLIKERHRHRYEVNIKYKEALEKVGVMFSGMSPDGLLPEIIELKKDSHPWFIGVQFHPELKSKIFAPSPLFISFVKAALENNHESHS
ncbi:MAG: CTP synthase [Alphaproteobacteria bacterium]|nr:CTP synthase [Alphaproteobacteria bacterium]